MTDTRPNPLGKIASSVGTAWSAAAAVVAYLVTSGVLSAAQGDAIRVAGETAPSTITQVGGAAAAVIALVGGLVSAFRTVSAGKDHVTPSADPRDSDGNKLTPDVLTVVGEHRAAE